MRNSELMRSVTGQKDPVIRLLRDLGTEEGRARENRFFAEGEELVRRAFEFGAKVDRLVLADRFAATTGGAQIVELAAGAGAEVYTCTSGLLAKVLEAKPTPDCLAICERKVARLEDAFAGDCPLVQMVEGCELADNLGMLLRSTDAAGVSGVVLAANTVDPFSRRVVRGSRGAVFTVPICIERDSARVIAEAKKRGLQVIATSARADRRHSEIDFAAPTMIVVGNEHTGISETVREQADAVVRIPMRGRINSLNIAVAASIVLYEAVRIRCRAQVQA